MSSRIREVLKAGYGKKAIGSKVFKRKLYNRYSDRGGRNFITYAIRAGRVMNSKTIKKQYKNNQSKLKSKYIEKEKKFLKSK